jgi:hypothetical protein
MSKVTLPLESMLPVPSDTDKSRVRPCRRLPANENQRFLILPLTGHSGPTKACVVLVAFDRQEEVWCVVGDRGTVWPLSEIIQPRSEGEEQTLAGYVAEKSPMAASFPAREHVRAVGAWGAYTSRSKLVSVVEALQAVEISGPAAWKRAALAAAEGAGDRYRMVAKYIPRAVALAEVTAAVLDRYSDCPEKDAADTANMALRVVAPFDWAAE